MIYHLFLQNLQCTPFDVAVIDSNNRHWTYQDVNERVLSLARSLQARGVAEQEKVVVLLEAEDPHYFLYLALDRLNAIYVPFDTDTPRGQLTQALALLKVQTVLVDDKAKEQYRLGEGVLTVEELKFDGEVVEFELPIYSKDDEKVSYLVSSSGSSGEKKWIPILGKGLAYWAGHLAKEMGLTPEDKVLATRSPGYDARISEYVKALSPGAPLVLIPKNSRKDFKKIYKACERHKIGLMIFIASQFSGEQSEKIVADFKRFGLRHLMVTGSACSPKLKELCEQHDINLWNAYGPTEATFGVSILRVNNLPLLRTKGGQACVPIGLPWGSEVRFHLVEGRLYIESPYLTPGYLNVSAEEDLFSELTLKNKKTVRVFDTENAFSMDNGFLVFEGRADGKSHCKRNGVKVTAHFIEESLLNYPGLEVAVVIKPYLDELAPVAYLVLPQDFDKRTFNRYLKENLRKEEIPLFVVVDRLPVMQPSNKIDRQALLRREDNFVAWYQEPSIEKESISEIESFVREVWGRVLGLDSLPNDIEFLLLGGTSLKSVEMAEHISWRFPQYSYQDLLSLDNITILGMVNQLEALAEGHQLSKTSPKVSVRALNVITGERDNLFFLPALLGEGYFTYKGMADLIDIYSDQNLYGLSDPGIYDEEAVAENFDVAVCRYLQAIKSIQPKGPYNLLGFSFGATLAYGVANKLYEQGETVKDLSLVDGFPPLLFQRLNNVEHMGLLQSLMSFLVTTLNNSFYHESIGHLNLEKLAKYAPETQVRKALSFLYSRAQNNLSKCLIKVSERHLEFILSFIMEKQKLPVEPLLYYTNHDQPYLSALKKANVSPYSTDYKFFFWNQLFSNLKVNCFETEGDHLSILDPVILNAYFSRKTHYFRDRNVFYTYPFPIFFVNQKSDQVFFECFFLSVHQAKVIKAKAAHLGANVSSKTYDQHYYTGKYHESITYEQGITLMVSVPCDKKAQAHELFSSMDVNEVPSVGTNKPLEEPYKSPREESIVHIHVVNVVYIYLNIIFKVNLCQHSVTELIFKTLGLDSEPESMRPINQDSLFASTSTPFFHSSDRKRVHYRIDVPHKSQTEAIEEAKTSVAGIMSVLRPAM